MPSYSASHPDPSCLTLRQHFHQLEQHRSVLKIEADEKYSRRQFIWRAKGLKYKEVIGTLAATFDLTKVHPY